MDTIDATFAEVVRAAIKDAGLNNKAVSNLIGIPYSTWRRKMQGHASFSLAEIHRLSKLLGSKSADLVGDAEAKIS